MSSRVNPIIQNKSDYAPFECPICYEEMYFDKDEKKKERNPVVGNGAVVELRCRECLDNWKAKNDGLSKSIVTGNELTGPQYKEFPDELRKIWQKAYQYRLLDSKTGLATQLVDATKERARLERELSSARRQIDLLRMTRAADRRPRRGSSCIVGCLRGFFRGFLYVLQCIGQVVARCLQFLARTFCCCLRVFLRGIYRC